MNTVASLLTTSLAELRSVQLGTPLSAETDPALEGPDETDQ
eukprot:SAG11_NODE_1580_length_4651_cov_5.701011_6_plen_41_part_00